MLAVNGERRVERAEGQSGTGHHGHIVGFVREHRRHRGQRNPDLNRRRAQIAQRAARSERRQRHAIPLALAHHFSQFIEAGRRDDDARHRGLEIVRRADSPGTKQPGELSNQVGAHREDL